MDDMSFSSDGSVFSKCPNLTTLRGIVWQITSIETAITRASFLSKLSDIDIGGIIDSHGKKCDRYLYTLYMSLIELPDMLAFLVRLPSLVSVSISGKEIFRPVRSSIVAKS